MLGLVELDDGEELSDIIGEFEVCSEADGELNSTIVGLAVVEDEDDVDGETDIEIEDGGENDALCDSDGNGLVNPVTEGDVDCVCKAEAVIETEGYGVCVNLEFDGLVDKVEDGDIVWGFVTTVSNEIDGEADFEAEDVGEIGGLFRIVGEKEVLSEGETDIDKSDEKLAEIEASIGAVIVASIENVDDGVGRVDEVKEILGVEGVAEIDEVNVIEFVGVADRLSVGDCDKLSDGINDGDGVKLKLIKGSDVGEWVGSTEEGTDGAVGLTVIEEREHDGTSSASNRAISIILSAGNIVF